LTRVVPWFRATGLTLASDTAFLRKSPQSRQIPYTPYRNFTQ